MDAPRMLVLLGSGETAPAMRAVHAGLLAQVPVGLPRLLLETTYGFQANEEEMTAKLLEWFAVNVGSPLEAAGLPRLDGPDLLERERGLARVAQAGYLLAGPGSPSFAIRQWVGSGIPERMTAMLRDGGTVVLASAAALTAGAFTLPVYEIYKAGEDPHWLAGLDLLAASGIRAAIVPHYDNAEGGGHDTRYCYMGARRLDLLEAMLPGDAWIIGIDEHTALSVDLAAGMASVSGKGVVTIRGRDGERRLVRGDRVPLADLRPPGMCQPAAPEQKPDIRMDSDGMLDAFRAAMAAGEIDQAASIALAAADSDDRGIVRAMIAALADAAAAPAPVDPRDAAEPFVRALLDVRAVVRSDKRWDLSDLIRDRLASASVIVKDTPDGPVWEFS